MALITTSAVWRRQGISSNGTASPPRLSARQTLGEIEQQVLCDMSRSIVNKILSEPTKSLKSAAERGDLEILKSLCELFRLEEKL